jgi:hypothetical protein
MDADLGGRCGRRRRADGRQAEVNLHSPGRYCSSNLCRTAAVTLVAWVFALMAGVANACLLHDRQPDHGQTPGQSAEASVDHDGHTSRCNDARDSGAATATKPASQESPGADWGPAAVQSRTGCLNPASGAVTRHSLDDGVLAHGPPSAIRFLRLRL